MAKPKVYKFEVECGGETHTLTQVGREVIQALSHSEEELERLNKLVELGGTLPNCAEIVRHFQNLICLKREETTICEACWQGFGQDIFDQKVKQDEEEKCQQASPKNKS